METSKLFFDSFKEFVWDIIGYLLPGSLVLVLLFLGLCEELYISSNSEAEISGIRSYVFFLIAYLLGYVAYGLGLLKEKFLGKCSYKVKIEKEIKKLESFKISRKLVEKSIKEKGVEQKIEDIEVRPLRNIVMSFIPDQDQKIYTFTFRSDLSNQTANISLLYGTIGLGSLLLNCFDVCFFQTQTPHLILYGCLIACYFLLRKTRNRFYQIAMSVPFSMYLAKAIKS